jgi:hypothetical protein
MLCAEMNPKRLKGVQCSLKKQIDIQFFSEDFVTQLRLLSRRLGKLNKNSNAVWPLYLYLIYCSSEGSSVVTDSRDLQSRKFL